MRVLSCSPTTLPTIDQTHPSVPTNPYPTRQVHLDDVPELRAEYKKKLASIELQLSGMVQVKVRRPWMWEQPGLRVVPVGPWSTLVGTTTTDRIVLQSNPQRSWTA